MFDQTEKSVGCQTNTNQVGKGAQWKLSDKNESIRVKKARAVLEEIAARFQLSQEK
jgi:hypothetical protein